MVSRDQKGRAESGTWSVPRSKQTEKVRVWGLVGNLAGQKDQEPTGKQICDIELRCHGAAEAVLLSQLEPPCSLSSPGGGWNATDTCQGPAARGRGYSRGGVFVCARVCECLLGRGEIESRCHLYWKSFLPLDTLETPPEPQHSNHASSCPRECSRSRPPRNSKS